MNPRNSNKGRGKNKGRPSRQKQRRRNRPRKSENAKIQEFWGKDFEIEELPDANLELVSDPTAVVRSLGRPPLQGHEQAAENYFAAVYGRAVVFAGALTAAEKTDEDSEFGEPEQ